MPLNVLDAHYVSFEREVLPLCQEQGIGVLAMKSFAAGGLFEAGTGITPQEALRYVMSLPVATVVSGMNSLEVLEQNLAIAQSFTPLTDEERADILARSAPAAPLGQYERFKSTADFEGGEGRKVHNVPLRSAAAD
jgi:aryl-alcohol dehydrogenase-like predicted oxidoreductase